ncbi:MAG: 3D domain-containing protein [Lachnospiraceae bacterium]|nr:3D domain-containing protein [Lachnospiraceae bacterium]
MKKHGLKTCKTLLFSFAAALSFSFPAAAASIRGAITDVDSQTICGWAWNKEDTNDVQEVEVHICQAGNPEPIKYLHVTADDYREDLVSELKDGWHGFSVTVDWSQLKGSDFKVKAYAIKDGKYYTLGDTISYRKASGTASSDSASAGNSSSKSGGSGNSAQASGTGTSLGIFTTSGYCGCEQCSSEFGLTYSGTVPQAGHTIAADLSLLPIGTKVRIGDTVYTVEDTGSSIIGKWIDIYYDEHQSADSHGLKEQEVFLVE